MYCQFPTRLVLLKEEKRKRVLEVRNEKLKNKMLKKQNELIWETKMSEQRGSTEKQAQMEEMYKQMKGIDLQKKLYKKRINSLKKNEEKQRITYDISSRIKQMKDGYHSFDREKKDAQHIEGSILVEYPDVDRGELRRKVYASMREEKELKIEKREDDPRPRVTLIDPRKPGIKSLKSPESTEIKKGRTKSNMCRTSKSKYISSVPEYTTSTNNTSTNGNMSVQGIIAKQTITQTSGITRQPTQLHSERALSCLHRAGSVKYNPPTYRIPVDIQSPSSHIPHYSTRGASISHHLGKGNRYGEVDNTNINRGGSKSRSRMFVNSLVGGGSIEAETVKSGNFLPHLNNEVNKSLGGFGVNLNGGQKNQTVLLKKLIENSIKKRTGANREVTPLNIHHAKSNSSSNKILNSKLSTNTNTKLNSIVTLPNSDDEQIEERKMSPMIDDKGGDEQSYTTQATFSQKTWLSKRKKQKQTQGSITQQNSIPEIETKVLKHKRSRESLIMDFIPTYSSLGKCVAIPKELDNWITEEENTKVRNPGSTIINPKMIKLFKSKASMDKFEDIRKELEEKELDAEDELELTGRDTEINELITNDTKHVLIKNMKDRYRRNKIREKTKYNSHSPSYRGENSSGEKEILVGNRLVSTKLDIKNMKLIALQKDLKTDDFMGFRMDAPYLKRKKKEMRQKIYWKKQVKPNFIPQIDEAKKAQIELKKMNIDSLIKKPYKLVSLTNLLGKKESVNV